MKKRTARLYLILLTIAVYVPLLIGCAVGSGFIQTVTVITSASILVVAGGYGLVNLLFSAIHGE
jgi:hypothetical protein